MEQINQTLAHRDVLVQKSIETITTKSHPQNIGTRVGEIDIANKFSVFYFMHPAPHGGEDGTYPQLTAAEAASIVMTVIVVDFFDKQTKEIARGNFRDFRLTGMDILLRNFESKPSKKCKKLDLSEKLIIHNQGLYLLKKFGCSSCPQKFI